MDLKSLLEKTSIANVVAGAILIAAVIVAAFKGDLPDTVEKLAFLAAGYLFGVTSPRTSNQS